MFKKALSVSACLVVVALLLTGVVMPASAAILSWEQYIDSWDDDTVTCVIPAADSYITAWDRPGGNVIDQKHAASMTCTFPANGQPSFQVWPMGANNKMTLADIPDGTHLEYTITYSYSANALYGNMISYIAYYDADFKPVSSTITESGAQTLPKTFNVSHTMDFPAGAKYFTVWCYLQGWTQITDAASYGIVCSDLRFTMDIEYLPDDSAILGSINDSLDELPDKIGDQFQDVIENEKEDSKQEGNEFVDQILDALPDPSADVLAAFKTLTDATSYQGTEAVLPIPALVLPGIDGLFPATEIWSGTQFDFGEYVGMLPATLLTLVQSLFTIAIVLYCVFELKSIISFVFTLNALHRGEFD